MQLYHFVSIFYTSYYPGIDKTGLLNHCKKRIKERSKNGKIYQINKPFEGIDDTKKEFNEGDINDIIGWYYDVVIVGDDTDTPMRDILDNWVDRKNECSNTP